LRPSASMAVLWAPPAQYARGMVKFLFISMIMFIFMLMWCTWSCACRRGTNTNMLHHSRGLHLSRSSSPVEALWTVNAIMPRLTEVFCGSPSAEVHVKVVFAHGSASITCLLSLNPFPHQIKK
jgi:hypothetical protein